MGFLGWKTTDTPVAKYGAFWKFSEPTEDLGNDSPDIWEKFQTRFKIPKIRELYGATEGVGALVNTHGRPGIVGRYMRGSLVIKCDLETGEPLRNSEGYCESVDVGETGLFISKL